MACTTAHAVADNLEGSVQGIFVASNENTLPKLRVKKAAVDVQGLEGDRIAQNVDAFFGGHGGPLKAVCLWSSEVVERLQKKGHPVKGGACGENILIAGIPWNLVMPGVRLEIGRTVLLEVTQYCKPCKRQTNNFKDGNIMTISELSNPGNSRIYAAVLIDGEIEEGARVRLHRNSRGAKAYVDNPAVLGRKEIVSKSTISGNFGIATHLSVLLIGVAAGFLLGVRTSIR